MLRKIISGGQTGADRGGLDAAIECCVEIGGTAPYKYMTEDGSDYSLKDLGLVECAVSAYTYRTQMNVKDSDGTVLFMNVESSGSKKTIDYCLEFNKPIIINPESPEYLAKWMRDECIFVLNVAGNRESKSPGIREKVKNFMITTIGLLPSYLRTDRPERSVDSGADTEG